MSTIGTGVAAGVAQTAHQAQRLSRARDRRETESVRHARRIQEKLELLQTTVEDGEEDETTPLDLRINAQLPHHEPPGPPDPEQRGWRRKGAARPDADSTSSPTPDVPRSANPYLTSDEVNGEADVDGAMAEASQTSSSAEPADRAESEVAPDTAAADAKPEHSDDEQDDSGPAPYHHLDITA